MIENYTVNLDGNMAANAKTDQTAVRGLAEQLGALQHSTTSLEGSINALGEKLESLTPHADHAKESTQSMFAALGEFELAKRGLELVGEGIVEAGRFAIEASEHVDEMTRSFAALLGTSEAGGDAALDQIRAIADTLPQASNQVEKWAQGLMAVGQTDMGKLNDSLHAIAGSEAMIRGGAEKTRALLESLNSVSEKGTKVRFNFTKLGGLGVTEEDILKQLGMTPAQVEQAKKTATLSGGQIADALTAALNEKAGGALAAQMKELGVAFTKGRDMVQRLFEGINFGPLAEQLRSLFSVFDEAFPSGDAMKKGIGGALQGIVNAVASAIPTVRHLFLEFVLDALLAYNAVRPLVAAVVGFFSLGADSDAMVSGLKLIGIGIAVIVGGFIALGVAAVGAVALVVQGLGYIEKGAEAAGNWLGDAVFAIVQFVSKAAGFAGDFIAGFVKGITDGIGNVTKAVESMGESAVSGIKAVLHINSPSVVMRSIGDDGIGGGLALGMTAANDNVHAAGSTLGARAATGTREGIASAGPPPPSFAGAAPGATREPAPPAPAGGDVHVNARFVVEISGAVTKEQAEEATEIFEEQWASLQERIALARGVAA